MGRLVIHYWLPVGPGWHPVTHMARLAAELLEGELVAIPREGRGRLAQIAGILSGRGRGGDETCLMICPSPADLLGLLEMDGWRRRYRFLAAWVFDSFWVSYIPRLVRCRRFFDHLFVTEPEDLEEWRRVGRGDVTWLPWGSDVLRLGSPRGERPLDALRVGRQPPEWEDDARTAEAFARHGLRFQGRPEIKSDATDNMRHLMDIFSRTKYTLCFSNRVSPSQQTHPTREYITGRWTDAIAAGGVVAGVPPATPVIGELLWPGALLEFPTASREEGLARLAEAARAWTPEVAARNYRLALEKLDWRWRFEKIAAVLGLRPAPLVRETEALRHAGQRPKDQG